MKYIKIILSLILINFSMSLYAEEQKTINYVTAEEIMAQLSKQPINVGFDIDATVLFSEPCIVKIKRDFIKAKHLKDISWKMLSKEPEYWNKVALCDVYSLPKTHTLKVLKMHQSRGDNIFFITARSAPDSKYEDFLNQYLAEIIADSSNLHRVIYAKNKVNDIKNNKITLFYGDSDSDLEFAKIAGAKSIRILRARNNSNTHGYHLGKFNEAVLKDSDY